MKSGQIGVLKISNWPKIAPLGPFGEHLIGCAKQMARNLIIVNFIIFRLMEYYAQKKIVTFADDTAKVSQSP